MTNTHSLHPFRLVLVAAAIVVGVLLILQSWQTTTEISLPAFSVNQSETKSDTSRHAVSTERFCSGSSCVTVTKWSQGDGRIRPAPPPGFRWFADIQAECKEKNMRVWETLTPDRKDHVGYHCAP